MTRQALMKFGAVTIGVLAAVSAQVFPVAAENSSVTSAVTAFSTTPLTNSPLGVTDVFPPVKEFHVNIAVSNAPKGTALAAIWKVVDAGGLAPPDTVVTSHRTIVEGSRFVDIVFSGTTPVPVGRYTIDIQVNNTLDRTLPFTVKEGAPVFTPPAPKPLGGCPPGKKPEYRPPLIARALTMAEGVKEDTLEPVNATRQFKPASVFHVIVELENPPANSKVKAVWYALDTGGLEPCQARLGETEITTSAARAWFNHRAPDKYPAGIYRVEVYVNGNLNNDVDFRVQ